MNAGQSVCNGQVRMIHDSKDGTTPRSESHGQRPPAAPLVSLIRQHVLMVDDDREARIAALLEDNIRTELDVQNTGLDLGLTSQALDTLAWAITAEVLYAFAVDWSPDWVKPGGIHTWESSGEHYSRCGICLRDSPPVATREDAQAWAASHEAFHGEVGRSSAAAPTRCSDAARPALRVGLPSGNGVGRRRWLRSVADQTGKVPAACEPLRRPLRQRAETAQLSQSSHRLVCQDRT